jgi:hypothetical protein
LPVSVCVVGEFAASLENESVAEAVPDAAGLNVTVKGVVWPAVRVVGREIPERANSLLLMLAAEMVTDDPVAPRVPFSEPLAPATTLPKLKLVGETDNWPCAVPVPESGTFRAGLDAVDVMAKLPLTLPPDVGENVTLKLTLWPAPKVIGKLKPLALNPEPVALTAEIVTLAPPELVRISASVWDLPT